MKCSAGRALDALLCRKHQCWFDGLFARRSTFGRLKTRLSIARLGVSVDITRLQAPPRPPKRQSKDCLFFCQSILAKTVITPDFLRKNRESGAFCVLWAILIYLQLLLPIFSKRVGGMATTSAERQKNKNFEKRCHLSAHSDI